MKSLVIVESPTKARTIQKFLGKGFEIKASYGHVRDLPTSASEIPKDVKKEEWSRIGVNVNRDFDPLYVIPEEKKKHVTELKKSLKNVDQLLLATDEDREGESISWHLVEILKPKVPVKRLVFHEITKEAIQEALNTPRDIDENLVRAQETRRIIDRLFGYSVSPLLWKKMAPRLSAGRVQSVALRLLVERERERIKFKPAKYWDLKGKFKKLKTSEEFEAELTHVDNKRIAIGKDFVAETGKLDPKSDVVLIDAKKADELKRAISDSTPKVSSVEEKPFTSKPSPPFTTSTLQQEASRKLSFAARRTMTVAQTLYENGFITYMRTDSTTLSEEALKGSREVITREFGEEYVDAEARIYKTKVRNAQEAHEAIRPAGAEFASIATVQAKLGPEAAKLYELIWKRTLASQMKDAHGKRLVVEIQCGPGRFRASGKTISFAGFLRAYVEGSDDPDAELENMEKILPALTVGEELGLSQIEPLEHTTQPPARYTEGSLIKELERLGIGRPSTWATIVDLVLSRTYAFKRGTALVPTFLAYGVIGLMEGYFSEFMDYEYTARLEDDLDAISRGEADNLKYLKSFYFGNEAPGLKDLVVRGEEKIDPRIVNGIPIGTDAQGRQMEVRIGRFGPFVTNSVDRASVPDNLAPDEMTAARAEEILIQAAKGPESLGVHPAGDKVYLKIGRFGPYIQLGEQSDGVKPKMVSLLPGMAPDSVTLEVALKLLELPKNLGHHPELKEDIIAANGRFGPYIKCGSETRSVPAETSLIDLTFEQAIELLKQPKTRGRRAAAATTLRELGKHPTSELPLVIKSGRYGPYVTDGTLNASLPRGSDPQALTMEEAVGLLQARADKGPVEKKKGARKRKKAA